jgi:Bacterial PH domain
MSSAEAKPSPRTFPSKRDAWISAVIWISSAVLFAAAVQILRGPGGPGYRLALAALCLAMAGFSLWVLYTTSYTFGEGELRIRSGPFRFRVLLDAVSEVVPTRNPLSSPACSLDRLRIRYGSRRIMISPEEKRAFLEALAERRPDLAFDGTRLVARDGG